MVNTDVFKTTIEDDLKEIAKRKLDILILQRQNETLCKENNEQIKKLIEEIGDRELSLEDNLSQSGERKIETPTGWCAYRAMPDKWEYGDGTLHDIHLIYPETEKRYIKVTETLIKTNIKKDILEGKMGLPSVKVTPQDPKFNYKLNSGGELL